MPPVPFASLYPPLKSTQSLWRFFLDSQINYQTSIVRVQSLHKVLLRCQPRPDRFTGALKSLSPVHRLVKLGRNSTWVDVKRSGNNLLKTTARVHQSGFIHRTGAPNQFYSLTSALIGTRSTRDQETPRFKKFAPNRWKARGAPFTG